MKKTSFVSAISAIVMFLSFGISPLASAALAPSPAPCDTAGTPFVTLTQHITNDADSGVHGNWATDAFTENVSVWLGSDNATFCATAITNDGTFVTAGGISPEQGTYLAPGVTGTFTGGENYTIPAGTVLAASYSTSTPTSTVLPDSATAGFSSWVSTVFPSIASSSGANYVNTYSLTYVTANDGTWTDADASSGGDAGDLGAVVNERTGTGYATIQSALDAAHSGDTINVSSGTYSGDITIPTSSITLQGVGTPVLNLDSGYGINLDNFPMVATGFTLSGFTVNASANTSYALKAYHADGLTLNDDTFNGGAGNAGGGVDINTTNNVTFNNVTATGFHKNGFADTSAYAAGDTPAGGITFNNVTSTDNGWAGIAFYTVGGDGGAANIAGVTFTGSDYIDGDGQGIFAEGDSDANFGTLAAPAYTVTSDGSTLDITHVAFGTGNTTDFVNYQTAPVNAVGATFGGATGNMMTSAQHSAEDARIFDKLDSSALGLVSYYIKDTVSPTAQFSGTPAEYVNGNFNVSGTASDNVALKNVFFDVRDPADTTGNSWRAGCTATSTVLTFGPGNATATISCTINTANLTEGTPYILRIHAGDYAGYGGGEQQTLIIDRTKPSAQITSPAQSSTVAGSFTITGTATDTLSGVDHVDIYIEHDPWSAGGYVVDKQPATWNATSGTFSYDASGIPDGVYAVKAVVYDKAGNVDYALSGNSGLIIMVSNAVPSLTITTPAADGDYATGTYEFTAAYANGTSTNFDWAIRTGTSCSSGTVAGNVDGFSDASTLSSSTFSATLDTDAWSDGSYCFVVNDLHGLRSTRLFTVDNTAPAAPTLVSPADGATVNGASVTQAWSDSDSTVDHFVYESFNNASATSLRWRQTFSSSTFSKTATNVATSTYWWHVEAFDAVGNVSVSPLWKLNVTNTPAAAPVTYVTTNAATSIGQSDAILNGTNDDYAAADHSFWVATSTFSTSSAVIPAGVYSTPGLGAIAANTSFSASLSSLTTNAVVHGQVSGVMPAIQPGTTYYYVAWSDVNGSWHPGAMQSFTTASLGSDDTLSALGVSNGTLSPVFDSGTLSYTDILPYNTTVSPTVSATSTDPMATVVVTQATSTTGTADVAVTAQNGSTTQHYMVNFSLAAPSSSFLTVTVNVDKSPGKAATSSDFTVTIIGASTSSFPGSSAGTQVAIVPDAPYFVNVSPSIGGYVALTNGDCVSLSGIPAGNSASCVITEVHNGDDNNNGNNSNNDNNGNNDNDNNNGLSFIVAGGPNGEVLGASIGGNDALEEQLQALEQQLLNLLQQYVNQLEQGGH